MAGPIARALLYARTLRHLRPRQLLYLPLRRLQRGAPGAAGAPATAADAPRLSPRADSLRDTMIAWGPRNEDAVARADAVLAGRFTFLNHTETLPRIDWRRRHVSHLWSYNLHYFDYAADLAWAWRLTADARYAERFVELATGWAAATAGLRGDGWEPYTVSLRVVNWASALLLLEDAVPADVRARLLASAHAQLVALERQVEWHLLANHLQKNLQALAVGGLLFDDAAARRWRARYPALLWREVTEQVLPDGGHFERSPMYHLVALVDLLETVALARAAGERVPAAVVARLEAMVRATAVLVRPDGALHLFNDAANGIAPPRAYADRLAGMTLDAGIPDARGQLALPDTGYFGVAEGGDRLLVDCGAAAPDYQMGHAHCDLLSFELDLAGAPVVVDSGVSGYDGDPLREYARSTRAHNTVVIAGREQHEVWGTFRVARRARVVAARARSDGGVFLFEGAYRPYHAPRAEHRRTVEREGREVRVTDVVAGAGGARLESHLHLHPDVAVALEGHVAVLRWPGGGARVDWFGVDAVALHRGETAPAQGWYCPEFGIALTAPCLTATVRSNDGRPFGFRIVPGAPTATG
ncbi:MAG: heparinase II/III family protein [Gemmatimonadaceae bacterium]